MAAILVVDDDVEIIEMLRELLEMEGHAVRLAANGIEGLAELERRLPDVVILDVEMPVLTGPGMAYRMFLHDAGMEHVPVIVASGAAHMSAFAAAIGTPYVLPKPYGIDALSRMIRRALSERIAPTPSPSFLDPLDSGHGSAP